MDVFLQVCQTVWKFCVSYPWLIVFIVIAALLENVIIPLVQRWMEDDWDKLREQPRKHFFAALLVLLGCLKIILSVVEFCGYEIGKTLEVAAEENNSEPDEDSETEDAQGENETEKEDEKKDEIGRLIVECSNQVIDNEVWEEKSLQELSFIRNGIFAYSGRKFKEVEYMEYYLGYEWYHPEIEAHEFKWSYLNYFQEKNINNIREIEEMKKGNT